VLQIEIPETRNTTYIVIIFNNWNIHDHRFIISLFRISNYAKRDTTKERCKQLHTIIQGRELDNTEIIKKAGDKGDHLITL